MTIKDIAKQAGVAKSTVSRVLNNSGYVRDETRRKVERVISESNYQPSELARNLSRKFSNIVGVVIPETDSAFYRESLSGMSEVVEQHDMTMMFCNTENNAEKELRALKMLEMQRVPGVVLAPVADYRQKNGLFRLRQRLQALNVPLILLERQIPNFPWDGVYFDNFNGAFMATEALIRSGHKKIGMITGNLNLLLGAQRFSGFKQAMSEYDAPLLEKYIYYGDFRRETAYRITREMLDSGDFPDAVLLSSNLTAVGFLQAVFEAGLTLGKDISCIGFEPILAMDIMNENYSYVQQDPVYMGRVAMQMLFDRIENVSYGRNDCIVPAKLVLKGVGANLSRK